jgi:hypothetical protein
MGVFMGYERLLSTNSIQIPSWFTRGFHLFTLNFAQRGLLKKVACHIFVLFCGLSGSVAWAGCADLSNATNWSDINTHKIIMYQKSKAIAVLEIPYCTILKSSDIRLIKDTVCNWDKVIVSGEVCDVRNVEKL